MEKKKKGREKEGEERSPTSSSFYFRHSDGQSSSGRELKSVYSTRTTLQEVRILPTLVYFHPKGTGFRY